jgi:hypothetical protein
MKEKDPFCHSEPPPAAKNLVFIHPPALRLRLRVTIKGIGRNERTKRNFRCCEGLGNGQFVILSGAQDPICTDSQEILQSRRSLRMTGTEIFATIYYDLFFNRKPKTENRKPKTEN